MITEREIEIAELQRMYENNIAQHRSIIKLFERRSARPESVAILFAEDKAERQLLTLLRENRTSAIQAMDILSEVLKWPRC